MGLVALYIDKVLSWFERTLGPHVAPRGQRESREDR